MSKARGKGAAGREVLADRVELLCVFDRNCLEDLQWLAQNDPRVAARALDLIEQVMREPTATQGPGKPESLKGLPNTWSRRLTTEHRLVYTVLKDRVVFLKSRYHYGD